MTTERAALSPQVDWAVVDRIFSQIRSMPLPPDWDLAKLQDGTLFFVK
jgi:hypothetical protein